MDAEKNQQEVLSTTNQIKEAILKNNQIFTETWELTHDWIDRHVEEHPLLKTCIVKLESLLGLQQTALQHCQDMIAGLEETIVQLVTLVKKLEKVVCWCRNQLLLPGPHYAPGEEEEVVEDSEEEEEEDGLEYKTNIPLGDSYTTLPSTGGCSKPSPHPSNSPTLEGSNLSLDTIFAPIFLSIFDPTSLTILTLPFPLIFILLISCLLCSIMLTNRRQEHIRLYNWSPTT